jgi:hypothetical protein
MESSQLYTLSCSCRSKLPIRISIQIFDSKQKRRPRLLGANMPIGIYSSLLRSQYKADRAAALRYRTHAGRPECQNGSVPYAILNSCRLRFSRPLRPPIPNR